MNRPIYKGGKNLNDGPFNCQGEMGFDGIGRCLVRIVCTLMAQRGTAESIDIPQFLKINFKDKTISGTAKGRTVTTTKIRDMDHIDGKLILKGYKTARAGEHSYHRDTGKMTVTASGN